LARRRQRQNLFRLFGGEGRGYVPCHECGLKLHYTDDPAANPEGYQRFERGKIFTKRQGGGYRLPNLLPECRPCNAARGDRPIRMENLE
jgi:hypothetical protein